MQSLLLLVVLLSDLIQFELMPGLQKCTFLGKCLPQGGLDLGESGLLLLLQVYLGVLQLGHVDAGQAHTQGFKLADPLDLKEIKA